MLREKIFAEIRRMGIRVNGRWVANEYNLFWNSDTLTYTEHKDFANEMVKLCEEGIFRLEVDYYVLTEKGSEIIYG